MNSLLAAPNVYIDENFILPKSLHLCVIRFEAEASVERGGEETKCEDHHLLLSNIDICAREEREAGAPQMKMEDTNH